MCGDRGGHSRVTPGARCLVGPWTHMHTKDRTGEHSRNHLSGHTDVWVCVGHGHAPLHRVDEWGSPAGAWAAGCAPPSVSGGGAGVRYGGSEGGRVTDSPLSSRGAEGPPALLENVAEPAPSGERCVLAKAVLVSVLPSGHALSGLSLAVPLLAPPPLPLCSSPRIAGLALALLSPPRLLLPGLAPRSQNPPAAVDDPTCSCRGS